MKVLVDTSVWSLALRRKNISDDEIRVVSKLEELVLDVRVVMLGIIRQELLSGISDAAQFERLKDNLSIFEDEMVVPEDYVVAAKFYNTCRARGTQGSAVDYLICALAARGQWEIFTTDKDFIHYANHLPIRLY